MLVVGALELLGGGGGVGKERETGRALLWGIVSGFFVAVGFVVVVVLWRTLLDRPRASVVEGRGRVVEGLVAVVEVVEVGFLGAWAIDRRAALAFVVRTTGAGFAFGFGAAGLTCGCVVRDVVPSVLPSCCGCGSLTGFSASTGASNECLGDLRDWEGLKVAID